MALRLAFPVPLLKHAFRLIVSDEGAGGATLFDLRLPANDSTPCDARDGWTSRGYVNVSNALPPDCTPGSALGLRKLRMKWNGTLDLRVDANPASIPHTTGPVGVTIYDGPGPVNECDGWSSQLACRSSPNSLRCDF
jgi:hypothetical protein